MVISLYDGFYSFGKATPFFRFKLFDTCLNEQLVTYVLELDNNPIMLWDPTGMSAEDPPGQGEPIF